MNTVAVLYGQGNGKLGTPVMYETGEPPGGAMAVASLRKAGELDIVVPIGHGSVSVLLRTATGFEEAPQLEPVQANALASGDFNGDGKPDLAVGTATAVQIYLGTGKASAPFTTGQLITVGTQADYGVTSIAVGDFNGDGKLDIALSYSSILGPSEIGILLGNGDGTFATPVFYTSGSYSYYIALGDVNGDGKLDVVTSGIDILLGKGDGTLAAPTSLGLTSWVNVLLADFNGDGLLDIALATGADPNQPEVAVMLNSGGGSFGPPIYTQTLYYPSYEAQALTAADVNQDGKQDLLVGESDALQTLLGNGDGTFQVITDATNVEWFNAFPIVVDDFSGSGKPELAVANSAAGYIATLLNEGDGNFSITNEGAGTGPGPSSMVSGRFHGPNKVADLVVRNSDGTLSVLINDTR